MRGNDAAFLFEGTRSFAEKGILLLILMWIRAILIWFCILIFAIINGAFRIEVLIPRTNDLTGHVISTLMLCAAVVCISLLSIRWIHPATSSNALKIGFLWLMMTLAFEFLFGHYVLHQPWPQLLADYKLAAGRIWILVLITTTLAPYLAARLRRLI